MSELPPSVDAAFRLLETRARVACLAADAAEDSVDELLGKGGDETLLSFGDDDPSLVRHIEDVRRIARGSSPGDTVPPASKTG
jgi:hypothetical protein